ncbi:MAG: phosphotransferase [Deltaproteobacteria bacterium]|nr:phosphotransferase [Deltaproteobacteria bacterium]
MIIPNPELQAFFSGFIRDIGFPADNIELNSIPSDGSQRLFWRISLDQHDVSFIGMENPPRDDYSKRENFAFLMIGRHLFENGLPIPEIHHVDLDKGRFILEDFGDTNLQTAALTPETRDSLYEDVVEILFQLQTSGVKKFDTAWCCQTKRYDQGVMRRYESDYFTDAFLHKYLGLKINWPELKEPFDHLAETASNAESHFFLHRDFQSRNIMVTQDNKIGIIDWQGGRLGPLEYDLASLVIDPYTQLSINEMDQVYHHYLFRLNEQSPGSVDHFKRFYPYLAIQRNLQILGAFSYLSKVQHKPFFETYIPPALRSLRYLLDDLNDPELSPLGDILNEVPSLD